MHVPALCTSLRHGHKNQSGASLLIAMIMLIVVMLLGTTAARMVLMNEKSSRNDRDRQIAFQAAEAGLRDAELALQSLSGRSDAFPAQAGKCHAGLCRADNISLWNKTDANPAVAWAEYGHFSGHRFPYGVASLPAQPPRYLIEWLVAPKPGASSDADADADADVDVDTDSDNEQRYRITAIGFGSRAGTQVFLQTVHAVHDDRVTPVRLSWREINN